MRDSGVTSDVSVARNRASVHEIEATSSDDVRTIVERLLARDDVSKAFSLQTCNRAGAYVVTDDTIDGRRVLDDFAPDIRDRGVHHMDYGETLHHLMRMASGLESLILGEDQTLEQVEAGIEAAREQDAIGPILEDALMKAAHTGERTHDETAISKGAVFLGSTAVRLAWGELDAPIDEVGVFVVGAGEMGIFVTKTLTSVDVGDPVVANRTVANARHFAREVSGVSKTVGLGDLGDRPRDADFVITVTSSPDYAVTPNQSDDADEAMLIDIAQLRGVDPDASDLAGIRVHNIDDLGAATNRTAKRRERAVSEVEAMIDGEFDYLLAAYKRKRVDEAISSMYETAEHVKHHEVSTTLSKLESQNDLTDEQRETVESPADTLVGQILAAPTKSLHDAAGDDDWTTIQTAMQLFSPDFGDLGAPEPAGPFGPSIEPSGEPPEGLDREVLEGEIPRCVLEQLSDD